jgi:hypothetical protein
VPSVIDPVDTALPYSHKPILDSYDSGEECSFYHWLDVCRLVDDADLNSAEDSILYSTEIEQAMNETLSEVEPATAYQHFSSDVV